MPNPEVSAIVSSIVAAFDGGMDVFRRLQKKRKQSKLNKKSQKNQKGHDAAEKEEERLCLSLQRGPRQIMGAYETNSGRLGERFRRGDGLAQTSLTHILLVLNAGLMRIISSIMATDTTEDELARRSLLSLSERSALDAVSSLEDLRQRLVIASSSSSTSLLRSGPRTPRYNKSKRHRSAVEKKRVPLKQQQQHQLPRKKFKETDKGPQKQNSKAVIPATKPNLSASETHSKTHQSPSRPEVVRGAWVRSRNGSSSSVAVIAPSVSKKTTPKATVQRKQLNNSARINDTKARKPPPSTTHALPASCPDLTSSAPLPSSNSPRPSSQSPPLKFTRQEQEQQVRGSPIPQPRQDISKRDNNNSNSNGNRISTLSISSGSTKLGEIPRHKWLTPWEPPADGEDDDEDASEEGDRHRNRVGFRFWRRFAGRSDN